MNGMVIAYDPLFSISREGFSTSRKVPFLGLTHFIFD